MLPSHQPISKSPFWSCVGALASIALIATGCRNSTEVTAAGTIEVVETDVSPLVARVLVEEGADVTAGQILAELTQPTTAPDIEGRSAAVAQSEARLHDLETGARPAELARAAAELRAADAEVARTARDVARLEPLAAKAIVSAQQFDAARTAARTAASRRDALRAQLELVQQGARRDELRAARANVDAAQAALAGARNVAKDLTLVAPIAGHIVSRNIEPGEVLTPGISAFTIGQMRQPWVRVYVDQQIFPRLRIGTPATATLDGLPGRSFRGRIVALNDRAEYTPRVALTEDERADLLFGVKVALEDTTGTLKPGLPVTVLFPTVRR
jgi:HlyD family secretion protein